MPLIARQAGVPFVRINERDLDPEAIALTPPELAYRHHIIPLSADESTIRVAVTDPFNVAVCDDIRMVTGRTVEIVFANPQDIQRLVEEHYMRRMMADTTDEEVEILDESSEELGDLERMAREATVIKFVNLILRQAVQEHASDVHVEPFEKGMLRPIQDRWSIARDFVPAQAPAGGGNIPTQDYGQPRYSRTQTAAGRAHQDENRRT